ncbi:hypothetical protein VPHF99_0138 [Vibrio phage F99]
MINITASNRKTLYTLFIPQITDTKQCQTNSFLQYLSF